MKKLVVASGGFDPLHSGHITYFKEALDNLRICITYFEEALALALLHH